MFSAALRSFAAGEISPALAARSDLVKYQTGLKVCKNMWVMKSGGVENRSGFRFLGSTKFHDKKSRGIPFVYSLDQTYRLEFGHLYMRVMRAGVQLEPAGSAWAASTVYVVGDMVYQGGSFWYCKTAHTSAGSFSATNWYQQGAYYEIPTPYTEDDLADLKWDQSADVVTLTHPLYAPRELRRYGHIRWTLSTITFAPSPPTPGSLIVTPATSGGETYSYTITFNDKETFEESLPIAKETITSASIPSAAAPHVLSWTAPTGYFTKCYREINGKMGYIGTSDGPSFADVGYTPDSTLGPPVARNPFTGTGNYPQCSTYYQQRHIFGGSVNDPERIEASRIGAYSNMTRNEPGQDDDAISFTMAGRRVNEVRHLLDLGTLVVLTSGNEVTVLGNGDGALLPTAINAKTRGYSGASKVPPAVVQDSAVFVQARGTILRDLKYQPEADGYIGRDLTVMAGHLFEGRTLTHVVYAESPNSIVWCLRDDGALLGLTYLRDHEIWGWHRHETAGVVEDICVVPEGAVDMLYAVIRRTIGGATKRYIERIESRYQADSALWFFVDSGLSYDGRNANPAVRVMLSGTGWTISDDLTLTCTDDVWSVANLGDEVVLRIAGELDVRCEIRAVTDGHTLTVRPNRTVPVAYRSVPVSDWGTAKSTFNVTHLDGPVVGLVDGAVVNATVTGGSVTLPFSGEAVHIGLPYTSEIETLPVDQPQGETLRDKAQRIRAVTLLLRRSRGGWVGDNRDSLSEIEQRQAEHYDDPIAESNRETVTILSSWTKDAGVIVQQRDPLPMSILAAIPHMQVGGA